MTGVLSQFGMIGESTYGTVVTPSRFFETLDPVKIKPVMGRAQSMGLRSGSRAIRSDRFVPFVQGGASTFSMHVPSKSFGIWLVHMLGTVATVGPTDSNYTHTGTVGSLLGDFFTGQTGNPFKPSGTVQPFTGEGGKVASWEMSLDVDGLLVFTPTLDFEDVNTSTGLASASFTAGTTVFAWNKGAVTFGGTSVELRNFKVGVNNGLDVDRRFLRGSALKKEPVENDYRQITWSGTMEFTDNTQYDRFVSATAAGAVAQIIATYTGPIIHAGATFPSLVITIPAARWDDVDITGSGPAALMQNVSGIGMYDGTNSPITVAYTTTDTTP